MEYHGSNRVVLQTPEQSRVIVETFLDKLTGEGYPWLVEGVLR